jgi:RND superfamily putative drug exporter
MSPVAAAATSLATSGRAVVTAALTVVIALLSLYAAGIDLIGQLGGAAALTVGVAALSALTLVPALLALVGTRIDRYQVRRPVAEGGSQGGGWQRYAQVVGARPWLFLVAGVALLGVIGVPFFSMQLGHLDAGSSPASYSDHQAYAAIARGFGVGANGPLTMVVDLTPGSERSGGAVSALAAKLAGDLRREPDVSRVTPLKVSSNGRLLVGTLIPSSSPQSHASSQLAEQLQDSVLPRALSGTGSKGYVAGVVAGADQFVQEVSSRLPLIIGVVLALAFLLILVSFRSPVLALLAVLLNLLSIGAAYGVVVATFQWGWGDSLLGLSEKVPIESYVPMMMFAIVFGLSMDYQVFLLSRVREAYLAGAGDHDSVAHGLAATARVISSAALIMASVFLAFLVSSTTVVKMLAVGLGASVLIDASVIRLLVVPSAMFILGRLNWWTPRWLEGVLPGGRPLRPAIADRATPAD